MMNGKSCERVRVVVSRTAHGAETRVRCPLGTGKALWDLSEQETLRRWAQIRAVEKAAFNGRPAGQSVPKRF